jgi:nucleotide-binding universal stress UspA family protein
MELAEKFNAELLLLHVVSGLPAGTVPESVCEAEIVAAGKLEAEKRFAVSQAALDGKSIKASTLIEVGNDVAGNILEAIERENAGLVVISTHGVSGWYPVVFGSVAEKIVKLNHAPLLLLRTEKPETSVKIQGGRLMEWW